MAIQSNDVSCFIAIQLKEERLLPKILHLLPTTPVSYLMFLHKPTSPLAFTTANMHCKQSLPGGQWLLSRQDSPLPHRLATSFHCSKPCAPLRPFIPHCLAVLLRALYTSVSNMKLGRTTKCWKKSRRFNAGRISRRNLSAAETTQPYLNAQECSLITELTNRDIKSTQVL